MFVKIRKQYICQSRPLTLENSCQISYIKKEKVNKIEVSSQKYDDNTLYRVSLYGDGFREEGILFVDDFQKVTEFVEQFDQTSSNFEVE